MALELFSLGTLAHIDEGRVRLAFEQALQRVEADLKDRPNETKPRKIAITLTFDPNADERGDLLTCKVGIDVKDNIPARRTRDYEMRATRAGLMWNELSPNDVHQKTIDEVPAPRPVTKEA